MTNQSQRLAVEIVVKSGAGTQSIFHESSFASVANADRFRASPARAIEAARKLQMRGFKVHHIGDFSISAEVSLGQFEQFFRTKVKEQVRKQAGPQLEDTSFYAPSKGTNFEIPSDDGIDQLVEAAYIQHEPTYFADERPLPPFWDDKFRLRVPVDVAQLMNASSVHRRGYTGKGIKVAMPDTGFYHHPYYQEQGYNFLAVTAPDVTDHKTDPHGHGTGEAANLFATAPGINFVGIKMGNPTLAFKTAVDLRPDVITCSWGYSVDRPGTSMPNWLKPLYLAVLDAITRGITVCFSAGNGHLAFPASIPEVIAVGGVHVDDRLNYAASDYASGFDSTWFPGRAVPDISGLCGNRPTADYIVLPVQAGSALDRAPAGGRGGGWGAFSGTSASSPMVAGVCALLKGVDAKLTPAEIKNLLKYTARDITSGTGGNGKTAGPGPDGATGFGLVDAARAVEALI